MHEYTFEYVYVESMPYAVKYVDENGNPIPGLETKREMKNTLSVVTETFVKISKMMPDAYQKRLILSATGESDPARRYHHRFVYKFEADGVDRVLTLTVGYTELCGFALDRLSAPIETVSKYADPGYGTVPFDAEGETRPILILGNSFISTSQIGSQLKAMFDAAHSFGLIDRTYSVEAYSRGYATVSKSWSDMLAPIKRGDYSAVFMCGFYSDSDETALRPYYEACLTTGTPLVIFPAHNESYGLGAVKMYPEAYRLDWRYEINRLIKVKSGL